MIIDTHTHIARVPNTALAEKNFEEIRGLLIDEMESSHIDEVLLLADFDKDNPMYTTTDVALKLVAGFPCLHVVGSVNVLTYKGADLAELEELLREKTVVGLKLYPGYQYFYPHDERCIPIYELCQRYDAPVIFHSGDTVNYETAAKIKYTHPLHIDDVATDFRNLKIIIAHLGNPWLLDCAEVLYKNENVFADLSGLVIGEGFHTPYSQVMRRRIEELIAYTGGSARKLLYGTDWPLAPMRDYLEFIQTIGIPENDMDYVLYKNARGLFHL